MGQINELYDKRSVLQVLGCLIKKPILLEEHRFDSSDFSFEPFYELIYSSIYNLFQQNIAKIDAYAIDSFLSNYKKQYAIFELNKGLEYCETAIELAELDNFEYYYNRLKKFTYLRFLEERGLDTRVIYNGTLTNPTEQEKEMAKLDNTSIDEMIDKIDVNLIIEARLRFSSDSNKRGQLAIQGLKELKERLKEEPEFGLPLQSPYLTTIARGARLKKVYLRSASSGAGKALPNNTVIPTPNGYRKVGDIKQGDYLFGKDGKPTKVLQIHPQPYKKEVYEITFKDGRKAQCCSEHLWGLYKTSGSNKMIVKSTEEIYQEGKDSGYKKFCKYNFRVPVCSPLQYSKKDFPIEPYIFGLMIGSGSFRIHNTNKAFMYVSKDEELVKKIAVRNNWNYKRHKLNKHCWYFEYKTKQNKCKNVQVTDILSDFPELINIKSEEKFIPKIYLQGDVEQRKELLRGLLDSNGSIKKKGNIEYTTVSEKLKGSILTLIFELGFKANVFEKKKQYREKNTYHINIAMPAKEKIGMFNLNRKKEVIKKYYKSNKSEDASYNDNPIIDIQPTSKYENMTCFTVDGENHLFVINDGIVTHNTRTAMADIIGFSVPYFYDTHKEKWIYTGFSEPSLFISTELDESELQTLILAYVSGVNESKILDGNYTKEEEERVDKAIEYIAAAPLYLYVMNDFSVADIENVIRKYRREKGCRYFCFDYLHTSAKLIAEIATASKGMKLREDMVLFLMSDRLKNLANELDIFILTMTQLNGSYKDSAVKDETMLAGAKSIINRLDLGEISLPISHSEMEAIKPILSKGLYSVPNLVRHVYKCRRGKLSHIRIFQHADLGTCRTEDLFVTDNNNVYIPLEITKLQNIEEVDKVLDEHSVDIELAAEEDKHAMVSFIF